MLLRLPYGKQTDPIESFAFEEFVGPPVHEELLWGDGSLALALLLGRAFTARGWDMEPGDERDIDGLPAYTFMRDGEPELQACAEHYLTERQIQAMLDAGLIPLASRRDRNAIVADQVSVRVGSAGSVALVTRTRERPHRGRGHAARGGAAGRRVPFFTPDGERRGFPAGSLNICILPTARWSKG